MDNHLKEEECPDTEPVVIHRKLRFLDEDLGRLASLYKIHWEKLSLFEDFPRHSPAALDTFAPNERCVVLVRLSKSGKQQGRDGRLPCSNLITDFESFHGKAVGIIIRNGENLYLGWTDEKSGYWGKSFSLHFLKQNLQPMPNSC